MKLTHLATYIFILSLLLSCKEDIKESEPIAQAPKPAIPVIKVPGSQAVLVATYESVQVDDPILGTLTNYRGIARADLKNSNGIIADGGNVFCDGQKLNYKTGVYNYNPAQDNLGIDFASSVDWSVTGRDAIPAFSHNYARPVPQIGSLKMRDTLFLNEDVWIGINKKNPFTNIGTPDSIIYYIHGTGRILRRAVAGSVDSIQLNSGEIMNIGAGFGYVQVEAYHSGAETFNGYQVTFVNRGILLEEIFIE